MMRGVVALSLLAFSTLSIQGCGSDDGDSGSGGTGGSAGTAGLGGSAGSGGGSGSGGASGAGGSGGALTCAELCPEIVPLKCPQGPPSDALCVTVCEGMLSGNDATCKAAMQALLACVSPTSDYSCDSAGDITSTDCKSEFAAIAPCLPDI